MEPQVTADGSAVGGGAGTDAGSAPRRPTAQLPRPSATASVKVDLPESLRYRLKNVLLGPHWSTRS